ncbi:MAG: hypothetical protein HYX86_05755 [Chloroflexi bacterium]|nr:hypothetical protein [Chloroflexota bacterium]
MIEILVPIFAWWLILQALGFAVLPLAFRIFRTLPDQGYSFAKILGLLLVSYVFWLLVSFQFLSNTAPAIAAVILVLALACYLYFPKPSLGEFWREKKHLVLTSEALFAAALLIWGIVRAYNPEITATEKPMEVAFLNATLRSEHFPPHDPWLSGYAISYYHFGYVMMALLTKLSGVTSGVGFNLGIALLFALTVLGAFGLGYNLTAGLRSNATRHRASLAYGLLAALLVAGIGNLEGILEVFYTRGLLPPEFVQFLDIKGLGSVPVTGQWMPTDNWWWWRASRVIHDSFQGQDMEVIDEFPFFSFLLGDMHPHLLALPFTLLALALAYKVLVSSELPSRLEMIVLWIVIGGLGFLNSWDLPTYGLIIIAAYGLREYRLIGQFDRQWLTDALRFGVKLFLGSIVLYLPFWITFSSQFGGLVPQLLIKTRLHQYLIMFGLSVFIATGALMAFMPDTFRRIRSSVAGDGGLGIGSGAILSFGMALGILFAILQWWLSAVLVFLIVLSLFALHQQSKSPRSEAIGSNGARGADLSFSLLLFIAAFLLTLSVEFFYIRDVFGTRMNTVFKFYYQAWVLFSIGSTYAMAYLWQKIANDSGWKKATGMVWRGGFFLLFAASLVYPSAAIPSKTNRFQASPTLDGTAFLQQFYPDEYSAIRWLDDQVPGNAVVLEAWGGSYTFYGRVSAYTGLPTLLGWGGHELQWRGNYNEPGRREPLIDQLYTSSDTQDLHRLLEEFDIQYVYVGFLERDKYGPAAASLERWGGLMEVAFQNSGVIILRRV